MKLNRYPLLGTLLLLSVGLVLGGCGKKDNPFEPNATLNSGTNEGDMVNAAAVTISPTGGAAMADLKPDSTGTQGEITIVFPVYMNAATINLTNIQVENLTPTTGIVTYYPELKKAVIQGTWPDGNYWCKVTITTGVLSVAGRPIDGNGNGKSDGAPYDNKRDYFAMGAGGSATAIDFTHPKLVGAWSGGGKTIDHPQIYFQFDNNDIDSGLIRNNVTLRDSTGHIVNLRSDGVSGGPGSWYVYWRPAGSDSLLPNNMSYTWTINLNAISDSHSNKAIWQNYGYIATLPNVYTVARTVGTSTQDWQPLGFVSAVVSGRELLVTFNDSLDYSTVNTSTVKVFKGSAGAYTGQIYGRVYRLPEDIPAMRLRFSLENATVGSTHSLWLSRGLKDNAGNYFDGNGDLIGNEPGIPEYTSGWFWPSDDKYVTFTP